MKGLTERSHPSFYSPVQVYRSDRPFRTLLYLYRKDLSNIGLSMLFYVIKHSPEWIKPIVTANIIDIISHPSTRSLSELWLNGAIFVVSVLQNIPTHYWHIWYMSTANHNMECNLRLAITWQLQHLSIDFYRHNSSGTLLSKLLRDVEEIQQLTNNIFQYVPNAVLTILIALAVTGVRAPWFVIFFLLIIPATVVLMHWLHVPIRDRNHAFRKQFEAMSARLSEMVQLIPVTRAHGAELTEMQQVERHVLDVKQAAMRVDGINAITGASSWVVLRLFHLVCLGTSAWLAYTGQMGITVGDVVLFSGYFETLIGSVAQIMAVWPQIGKGFESLYSVGELLECPDLEHNQGKTPVKSVRGDFTFESVSFAYPDTKQSAIQDFSLEVKAGETIAIVGPSGAGKSTLLNLIVGFLRPTRGQILLDGEDMNTLDLRTYRRFLSVVSQETILFSGTVRENILYAGDGVSDEQLWQAIADANALDFIRKLPKGLDTVIGPNGMKLSGGQRQRIAIARALIRNPQVLILDEATSALDSANEALIQEALERLMSNRTTFVVAHRLSTVRHADRIVVLEGGRIVEVGNHAQLLANNGMYGRLHALQIGGNWI